VEALGHRVIQAAMLVLFRAAAMKLKAFRHRQVPAAAVVAMASLLRVTGQKVKAGRIRLRNGKTMCFPRIAIAA